MTLLEPLPPLWLGQSVRTTLVVDRYPTLAGMPFMASLGDAIHRPRLVDGVFRDKLRSRLRATGPLMLDSGGFTLMMKSSASLDVTTLGDLYQTCGADLVVALDQPATGQDPPADRDRKHAVTLDNLKVLARVVDHARLVPVIHGPDIADIERNAAASAAIVPLARLVALGGLVPTLRYSAHRPDEVLRHLTAAVDLTKAAFPNSAVHILGAGAPRTLSYAFKAGASSVDSIGWRRAAGFGTIFLAGRGERFVEHRDRERPRSRLLLDTRDHIALLDCACPPCATTDDLGERIALLASHYMPRAAHNAWTLQFEAIRGRAAANVSETRSTKI